MSPPNSLTSGRAQSALSISICKQVSATFTLDVMITAPPGISILFGASGAGKTTLLDCVAGLISPDSGRIAIAERTLFDREREIDIAVERRGVGYVFQKLALFPHLSVARNVEYGLAKLKETERRTRTERMLEAFRIAHLQRRKPGEISGGERQRVALARALVTDPCVLLLDEPLTGLDAPTRSRLLDDLRAWNETHAIPVLYVTHTREEVFALGERVIMLEAGKVIAAGTPYEVLDAPRRETTAQLAGIENIFDATIVALHEDEGTMTCSIEGGAQLNVPLARMRAGARVRIAVRAGDVLLANREPQGISARNILAGTIVSLTRRDVMVIAEVDCGARFTAHLTPAAMEALSLATGRAVWLIVKTHSCHLLRSGPGPE